MAATIEQTDFQLPGQIDDVRRGKVGDIYRIAHIDEPILAVVRSDRISAFNHSLARPIPHKGQVLNEMSADLLAQTRDIASNWLIDVPDPNVSLGFEVEPLKVEMIMRGFLLGSSWKGYKANNRNLCGNRLPEGMKEFEPFAKPLVTPTTKTATDDNITPKEIVKSGLATQAQYDQMVWMSRGLFEKGQLLASQRGLLLADTKFEFGVRRNGQVILIDEALTPDSSRYFPQDEYTAYLNGQTTERPKQQSKEYAREWLESRGFNSDSTGTPPVMPDEVVAETSDRYIGLYEQMLGRSFVPAIAETRAARLEQMQANIISSLKKFGVV